MTGESVVRKDSGSADALHILIVGAGTVGLLIAQALKKAGIRVSVFEAEPNAKYTREREWGTSIQWGLPLLEKLLPEELLARLPDTTVDPSVEANDSMAVYNAKTGVILKQVPMPRFVRVSRHKFRALCAEGIDIQYSKRLSSATATKSNVTLNFTDSTTATGTLLIGSDGAHSATRKLIYGPVLGAAAPIPFKAINMHVCYNSASTSLFLRQALIHNSIMAIGFHPVGYWLWLSIQDIPSPDPSTWVFQLQWTWPDSAHSSITTSPKPTLEELQHVATESFAEPWRTAWGSIPASTLIYSNSISTWTPIPVPSESPFSGRVALAGDAAHAMSFHRGQGLNHGIADAVKLSEVLMAVREGTMGVVDAVAEYESEMVTRSGEEVKMGKGNTEMVHDWERVMASPFMKIGGAKTH